MYETPWVERHTAFEDLRSLQESIIHCLGSIQCNDDPENCFDSKTVIEASGLLNQLQNPSFITPFQTGR